jgi:hypothetical protein
MIISIAWIAERGAEERKGSTGVLVPGSPGFQRWRVGGEGGSGKSSGVGRSGLENGARRSGGGAVGGGDARAPFYRVRGGSEAARHQRGTVCGGGAP